MQNKMTMIILQLLIFLTFASQVSARKCDNDEWDKAEYFSENAGHQMVEKYGGGRDIRIQMNSCYYNSYSGIFKTTVGIYWNGSLVRSNKYNIDGEFKMKSDGSHVEFAEEYANEAVKDIRFWGYVAGGVVVLTAIANEKNN